MESGILVRALHEFSSKIDGELNLNVGSVLQVIRSVNQYWSYGCLDGVYGNFPTGYVTEIQLPDNVVTAAHNPSSELFIAKDRFRAAKPHELSMDKGDIILGLEPIDDHWYRGIPVNNVEITKAKIFPVSYVWKVDMELLRLRLKSSKQVSLKGKVNMNLKAQLDEEIDLYKDDIVTITEIIDDDWYRGYCNGKEGVFPKYVISVINDESHSGNNNLASSVDLWSSSTSFDLSPTSSTSAIPNPSPEPEILENNFSSVRETGVAYARALFPFHGEFSNELNFETGDIIYLKRRISDEWLEGETRSGNQGLFPRCYVHVEIDLPDNSLGISSVTEEPVTPVKEEFVIPVKEEFVIPVKEEFVIPVKEEFDTPVKEESVKPVKEEKMVALYDFYPQVDGDVPVMEGERVTVLERPDSNWCKVRNAVGAVGLCPGSYLQPYNDSIENNQVLQRQWSLPVHSKRPLQRSTTLTSDVEDNYTHHKTASHWSVNVNSNDRCDSKDIRSGNTTQQTPTPARVLRPAPAPPTNISRNPPKRSLSAVGNRSYDSSRRSDVQLRHQANRVRRNQRRKVVTMEEIPSSGTRSPTESTISEISNEISEFEFRSRSRSGSTDSSARSSMMELKNRNRDKRDMIIAELMKTEKDYIHDMEYCKTTFMTNPEEEKRNGLDVDILFGNLPPLITVSRKLSKSLEAISSQPIEHKQVGNCFNEMADEMREAYAKYCCDHDEIVQLLDKYEDNRDLTAYIRQKLESGGCSNNQIFLSLSSLVIKPIQRITKYPLLLNELVHVTEESSEDYSELITAFNTMSEVANTINELKRRKDLVQKYRKDADTSISSKLAKINLHSVVKKSTRLGMRLSSSLGLSSVTKDWIFDEEEHKFRELEKTMKQLLLNIESFMAVSEENVHVRLRLSEKIGDFYDEERAQKIVDKFRTVQRIIASNYWPDFKRVIEKRVTEPLVTLLFMFEGPTKLIDKRIDKLLDYDRASLRLEKNKDASSSKVLRDELEVTKKNYMALNFQLLEELPKLTKLATEIFVNCIAAFIHARSKYVGLAAKQLLEMAEAIPNLANTNDIIDSFLESHRSLINRMIVQGLVLPDVNLFPDESDSTKMAVAGKAKPEVVIVTPQSSSQRAYLQGRYSSDQLYTADNNYTTDDQAEVPVNEGDIVAVLIKKDPMGNSNRWLVDNGNVKGLLPAKFLVPFTASVKSEKTFEALFESSSSSTLKTSLYAEKTSRTPSPLYFEPDEHYNQSMDLNTNGYNRYDEIYDPAPAYNRDENVSPTELSSTSTANQYYKAAYEFRASGSNELSMALGQQVLVLQKEDMEGNTEWWFARDRYGRQGFVPGNYLVPCNQ